MSASEKSSCPDQRITSKHNNPAAEKLVLAVLSIVEPESKKRVVQVFNSCLARFLQAFVKVQL